MWNITTAVTFTFQMTLTLLTFWCYSMLHCVKNKGSSAITSRNEEQRFFGIFYQHTPCDNTSTVWPSDVVEENGLFENFHSLFPKVFRQNKWRYKYKGKLTNPSSFGRCLSKYVVIRLHHWCDNSFSSALSLFVEWQERVSGLELNCYFQLFPNILFEDSSPQW